MAKELIEKPRRDGLINIDILHFVIIIVFCLILCLSKCFHLGDERQDDCQFQGPICSKDFLHLKIFNLYQ